MAFLDQQTPTGPDEVEWDPEFDPEEVLHGEADEELYELLSNVEARDPYAAAQSAANLIALLNEGFEAEGLDYAILVSRKARERTAE